ncbi:MAG TPA: exodeoxyribonuclease VII large subunit [Candidatus Saccharimonadales bacterium]|nr:exodeoxyribonuclease VII large subunit [Candidatus Saccharimonadales bacterium]
MQEEVSLSVSEFIAVFNQSLEYAYPSIIITGELANFRVSRNRWVYFDLKDEASSLKFFGTVYQLPGPLEEGMILKVRGQPRLHNLYGFSINILSIRPAGEGSIRKAADLLQQKLQAEGLFDPARKRHVAYPPERIGLITATQSAAYADFCKIINQRWGGLEIQHIDVQVQGEAAPIQIAEAINYFNVSAQPPEVLVVIRGGGSAEDLASFSTEQVTRAVAASRVPTIVAIGHEVDISLAELAADLRASTPSNAAELLVPDKKHVLSELASTQEGLNRLIRHETEKIKITLVHQKQVLSQSVLVRIREAKRNIEGKALILAAFNPTVILKRGYSIIRLEDNTLLKSLQQTYNGGRINVTLHDGSFQASIVEESKQKKG